MSFLTKLFERQKAADDSDKIVIIKPKKPSGGINDDEFAILRDSPAKAKSRKENFECSCGFSFDIDPAKVPKVVCPWCSKILKNNEL
jgi:hypothetical protein